MSVPLFAYGTLMAGGKWHRLLGEAFFVGRGWVEGKLFLVEDYPALVSGHGHVSGELYLVDEKTLKQVDQLEGIVPRRKALSEYWRTQMSVRFGARSITAFVYVYLKKKRLLPLKGNDFGLHARCGQVRIAPGCQIVPYPAFASRLGEVIEARKESRIVFAHRLLP